MLRLPLSRTTFPRQRGRHKVRHFALGRPHGRHAPSLSHPLVHLGGDKLVLIPLHGRFDQGDSFFNELLARSLNVIVIPQPEYAFVRFRIGGDQPTVIHLLSIHHDVDAARMTTMKDPNTRNANPIRHTQTP